MEAACPELWAGGSLRKNDAIIVLNILLKDRFMQEYFTKNHFRQRARATLLFGCSFRP